MQAIKTTPQKTIGAALMAALAIGSLVWLTHQPKAIAANAAPPPPAVEVVEITPIALRSWAEFSGRLSAVESASLKPQVSGVIQKVLFSEGQDVKAGQALFVIDPRPHEAALLQAKARLASAQSQAKLAQDELTRAQQLLKQKLIAGSLYDASVNAAAVAQAQHNEAQAAVAQAQLNVDYAHISAPISGRISRAELTVGNTVEAGANAPVLARIAANKTLYAEFTMDEASLIKWVNKTPDIRAMPVMVHIASDKGDGYQGHLESLDNHIDTATGTIRARAIIDNPKGELIPGMFAHIRLGSAQELPALLIPDKAIGTNQSKKFVLVVDEKNIANYREVTLGDFYDGQRVVLAGLTQGERIITNGLSRVRPNTAVSPTAAITLANAP
jgi:membrane fusion protein, multidrug efflux system